MSHAVLSAASHTVDGPRLAIRPVHLQNTANAPYLSGLAFHSAGRVWGEGWGGAGISLSLACWKRGHKQGAASHHPIHSPRVNPKPSDRRKQTLSEFTRCQRDQEAAGFGGNSGRKSEVPGTEVAWELLGRLPRSGEQSGEP